MSLVAVSAGVMVVGLIRGEWVYGFFFAGGAAFGFSVGLASSGEVKSGHYGAEDKEDEAVEEEVVVGGNRDQEAEKSQDEEDGPRLLPNDDGETHLESPLSVALRRSRRRGRGSDTSCFGPALWPTLRGLCLRLLKSSLSASILPPLLGGLGRILWRGLRWRTAASSLPARSMCRVRGLGLWLPSVWASMRVWRVCLFKPWYGKVWLSNPYIVRGSKG